MTNYPIYLCHYIATEYFLKNYPISNNKPNLLDVGSGNGDHIAIFDDIGFSVYGIDKNPYVPCTIKANRFKKVDLEVDNIPYPDNYFDFIFSKSVIEHIFNTEHLFKEMYRVLKPDGKIIIMTPDYESRYKDFWEEYTHIKPFTLKSLWHCLEYFGFKNVKVKKFYQLPFTWHRPYLKFIPKVISLLPDSLKWKDKKQSEHRPLIRFSKELMLLGYGEKWR